MAMGRIVVVDDDAAILNMMELLLSMAGYQTVLHNSGTGAYTLIRKEQPDVAILDMRMEQLDSGLQVLTKLRQDPATACIPAIVCTGEPSIRAKVDLFGVDHYEVVKKPFQPDLLVAKVEQMVKQRREHEAVA